MHRRRNVTRDAREKPLLVFAHRAILLAVFLFKFASAARAGPGLIDRAPEWLQGIILEQLPLTRMAQLIFVSLAVGSGYVVLRSCAQEASLKSVNAAELPALLEVLKLYLFMQTIPGNIPLLLIYRIQLEWIGAYRRCPEANVISLTHMSLTPSSYHTVSSAANLSSFQLCFSIVLFTHSAFFAFGNANANTIAALRYTEGFNGLQAHHWLLSPVHTFCSNYAGPIW
ncbi:uncharacterized protein BO66DRAFT_438597 [Aspergillus aculeatinus CBS 121060]|uniref:Uncharacterized protein n=1 Tax=Aspergillus aculeatinus CBS 121060 TaxID=1448322 RepID=A0ACD1H8K0_9EURO|nr:hypothetical protein BO66DRAFT_438597 [Aspergillus aculeatinus CBS 121060]RAH69893.1 hypothetical protein BO66DRAFT_438597 [Aspergillus aculeatinus CBS 121060]